MSHVPYPGCYCADCVEGGEDAVTKVVRFLREQDGFGEWHEAADAIEREFAAPPPSARITGDKDRSVQSRAPTQRIIILTEANRQLAIECHRLRSVLRWIADTGYVDHQSGNQNFEHLQSIARDALTKEPTP